MLKDVSEKDERSFFRFFECQLHNNRFHRAKPLNNFAANNVYPIFTRIRMCIKLSINK